VNEDSYLSTIVPLEQQAIRAKCVHPTGTFNPFPAAAIEQSIPVRFEQQVRMAPDRIAVKTSRRPITYDELNQTANRIAHAILTLEHRHEQPVALLLENDMVFFAAVLGAIKAGKCYVPLDVSFPQKQLAAIVDNAQPGVIVTDETNHGLAQALLQEDKQLLNLNRIGDEPATNLDLDLSPDTLACILYTSGSTGQPKGVMHNHRNILHLTVHDTNSQKICMDDRLTLLYSSSTMGGMRGTFDALLNGATLYPFAVAEESLEALIVWLIREEITIWNVVLPLFRHCVSTFTGQEHFPALRVIRFGGEQATRRDVECFQRYFSSSCCLCIGLGTTETLAFREYWMDQTSVIPWQVVPAGYGIADMEALVLDKAGNHLGVNQIGEIAVKSHYLALGYWRQPERTQAVFQQDPTDVNKRLYLTGDLGRLQPGGLL
jgi:non-ribosomal peptide synthetase component F